MKDTGFHHHMLMTGVLLGFIGFCLLSKPAYAVQDRRLPKLCYHAIDVASKRRNVPRNVLLAISLTETGRKIEGKMQPWPWTVNMEGKGEWFGTRDEALTYVRKHYARGARSFDTGCFQINYKWHHQHFSSLEAMFDPVINTDYAARFLTDLFGELGSWSAAAGAYHSRTPKYATRYAKRFDRYLAFLAGKSDTYYSGHGSEGLIAETAVAPSLPQQPSAPPPPILRQLVHAAPRLSPAKSARGSLFSSETATPILRAARGSLF